MRNSLASSGESAGCDHHAGEIGRVAAAKSFLGATTRFHEITFNLVSVERVVERENVRICHVQHLNAEDASHLLLVDECWIAELLEPCEVVEDGVVNAVVAAGTNVSGWNAHALD